MKKIFAGIVAFAAVVRVIAYSIAKAKTDATHTRILPPPDKV